MKNPPADCSGRVWGGISRDAIGQRALMTSRSVRRFQSEMNRRRALFTDFLVQGADD